MLSTYAHTSCLVKGPTPGSGQGRHYGSGPSGDAAWTFRNPLGVFFWTCSGHGSAGLQTPASPEPIRHLGRRAGAAAHAATETRSSWRDRQRRLGYSDLDYSLFLAAGDAVRS